MARRFDRTGWAMAQKGLSAPQKAVLFVLADAASEQDGSCWLAHGTIAERTSLGVTTVRDAVRELSLKGLLGISPRFGDNGKQTSNRYTLGCYINEGDYITLEELVEILDAGLKARVSGADTQPGADTSPVGSRQHVEQATRTTTRKNNSQTASGSRPSRRAARARADRDEGWSDPAAEVFAGQQDESTDLEAEPTSTRRSPDSAWGLNGYYRNRVFIAGTGRVGNTNDGAMRKFFAAARKAGVAPETLRAMVDCFVADPQLFDRAKGNRWRIFIANAATLQERAERVLTTARIMDPETEPVAQFGGAIPQSVLDEILDEAG